MTAQQPPPKSSIFGKPPDPPKNTDLRHLHVAIHDWWAEDSGSIETLAEVERAVRAAKPTKAQILHELVPRVPHHTTGPAGQRCARMIDMLKRVGESL